MFFLLPPPHSIHLPPTSGPLPRRRPTRFSDAVKWALSIIQDLPLCCCRRGCCLWCHRSCWWLHFLHCNEPGPATYPPLHLSTPPAHRCSGSFVKAEAAHYPPCLCCHCSCCRRTHDAGWWENARLVWHFHYRCGICAFLWQTFDPGLHRPTGSLLSGSLPATPDPTYCGLVTTAGADKVTKLLVGIYNAPVIVAACAGVHPFPPVLYPRCGAWAGHYQHYQYGCVIYQAISQLDEELGGEAQVTSLHPAHLTSIRASRIRPASLLNSIRNRYSSYFPSICQNFHCGGNF